MYHAFMVIYLERNGGFRVEIYHAFMVIYTLLRVEEKNIILDRYFPLKREFFYA